MTAPLALVIEDDPTLAAFYRTVLEKAGFVTDLDPDGNQYRHKVTAPNLALILLDLHMPYASGIDILHDLRADPRWQTTPIIITTADLYLAKTIGEEATRILIKPVSIAQLLETVTPYLS